MIDTLLLVIPMPLYIDVSHIVITHIRVSHVSRTCVRRIWERSTWVNMREWNIRYGVALVSRIDTIIGLFCKRALEKSQYSAKETYNFIDPTNRSHPIHWSLAGSTGWQGDVWCLICIGHFAQKSPIISDSFAERDLQLEASYVFSPPCTDIVWHSVVSYNDDYEFRSLSYSTPSY